MSWIWQAQGGGNGGGGPPQITGWNSIYEVDFRALPNQTIAAAGSYTIDRLTWWCKGAPAAGQGLAVVNGVGLRQQYTGAGAIAYTPTGNIAYATLHLPLDQLTRWSNDVPLCVQTKWSYTGGGATSYALVGLCLSARDSAQWLNADRPPQMLFGPRFLAANAAGTQRWISYNSQSAGVTVTPSAPAGDLQYNMVSAIRRQGTYANTAWTGAFVSPADSSTMTSTAAALIGNGDILTRPSMVYVVNTQVGENLVANIEQLRILRAG